MAPADSGYQVNPSDCCGNGCVNCILDTPPAKISRSDLRDKVNVLLSYRSYELLACDKIQPKIMQLHFKYIQETADNDQILYIPPGHHLMMRATPQVQHARPYSPFWSDIDQLEFKILINLSPNGIMSKYIEQLAPGDKVEFRGPIGMFQHNPKDYTDLLLICHGVAIAPLIAIIQGVLDDEEDMTRIQLYACFENLQTTLFRKEIYEFNRFWNFHGKLYLSRPEAGFASKLKYKENIVGERLNRVEIKKYVDRCKDLKSLACVVSGSNDFQESFKKILLEAGLDVGVIHLL